MPEVSVEMPAGTWAEVPAGTSAEVPAGTSAEISAMVPALEASAAMVAALLADGADTGRRAGPDKWTVRETAVHLVAGARMYGGYLEGAPPPIAELTKGAIDGFNAAAFRDEPEADGARLARRVEEAVAGLAAVAADVPDDRMVGWHGGVRQPARFLVRAVLAELLLHGWDMAQVLGRPWDPQEAVAAPASRLFPEMAPFLFLARRAAGLEARYRFETTSGVGWGLVIDGDSLAVVGADAPADCDIRGTAFDLMLWDSRRLDWAATGLRADGPRADAAPDLMTCFVAP